MSTGKQTSTKVFGSLVTELRQSIASGQFKPGELIGSEYELARRASISRMSVRKASELLIEEGLIERRPGKGLFVREPRLATRLVQVVVPDLQYDQCVKIARGAKLSGNDRGAQVQVYDAHGSMASDIEMLRRLPRSGAHGAIIASWHHPRFAEVIYELKSVGFPFVLVDERMHELDVPSVVADNHGGGLAAGRALVEAGHRRIGFVGPMKADTVRARLEGLRDAVGDAGLPFDRSLALDMKVEPNTEWRLATERCTRELLERPDRPTAIFYANDQIAADGIRALRESGYRVPHDISVCGFDDDVVASYLEPALSTVRQPSLELGRRAMELLVRRMADPRGPAEHEVLPTEWVARQSVARIDRD